MGWAAEKWYLLRSSSVSVTNSRSHVPYGERSEKAQYAFPGSRTTIAGKLSLGVLRYANFCADQGRDNWSVVAICPGATGNFGVNVTGCTTGAVLTGASAMGSERAARVEARAHQMATTSRITSEAPPVVSA